MFPTNPHMPNSIQNPSRYAFLSFQQPNHPCDPSPKPTPFLHPSYTSTFALLCWSLHPSYAIPTAYPTESSLSVCELPLAAIHSAPLPSPQVHERFLIRTVPHSLSHSSLSHQTWKAAIMPLHSPSPSVFQAPSQQGRGCGWGCEHRPKWPLFMCAICFLVPVPAVLDFPAHSTGPTIGWALFSHHLHQLPNQHARPPPTNSSLHILTWPYSHPVPPF